MGRSLLVAAPVVTRTVLVGCQGAGSGSSGASPQGGETSTGGASYGGGSTVCGAGDARVVVVKETDSELAPATIRLDGPGTYVFKAENDGESPYALEEKARRLFTGENGQVRVELGSGTYEMYCPVDGHEQMGMEGKVTVG